MSDPKDLAQQALADAVKQCPVGVYHHYKGDIYVVYDHTLDEATLAPLVHYFAVAKATRWTRTVENFIELVDGQPRFKKWREATAMELRTARGA